MVTVFLLPSPVGYLLYDLSLPDENAFLAKRKETKNQKHTTAPCSLVVTDPTTLRPISGLCMGDLTGTPVFRSLWSYVHIAALFQNRSTFVDVSFSFFQGSACTTAQDSNSLIDLSTLPSPNTARIIPKCAYA